MKNLFKTKGISWALGEFIGTELLNSMSVSNEKLLVKEIANRFSVSEEGLTKLLAAKLNLLYLSYSDEEINAKINLYNFQIAELKEKGFVIHSADLNSVKLLCFDPRKVKGIGLKTDSRKIELVLGSWPTISKFIEKIEQSTSDQNSSLVDEAFLWKMLEKIIDNVEAESGSSFEVIYDRKDTKYTFIDSSLLVRGGDIDSRVSENFFNFLTKQSLNQPEFEKALKKSAYYFQLTVFPKKASIFVRFRKITDSNQIIETEFIKSPEPLH